MRSTYIISNKSKKDFSLGKKAQRGISIFLCETHGSCDTCNQVPANKRQWSISSQQHPQQRSVNRNATNRQHTKTQHLTMHVGKEDKCHCCGNRRENMDVCAGCFSVFYCSDQCHRSDWRAHKHYCRFIRKNEKKKKNKKKPAERDDKEDNKENNNDDGEEVVKNHEREEVGKNHERPVMTEPAYYSNEPPFVPMQWGYTQVGSSDLRE